MSDNPSIEQMRRELAEQGLASANFLPDAEVVALYFGTPEALYEASQRLQATSEPDEDQQAGEVDGANSAIPADGSEEVSDAGSESFERKGGKDAGFRTPEVSERRPPFMRLVGSDEDDADDFTAPVESDDLEDLERAKSPDEQTGTLSGDNTQRGGRNSKGRGSPGDKRRQALLDEAEALAKDGMNVQAHIVAALVAGMNQMAPDLSKGNQAPAANDPIGQRAARMMGRRPFPLLWQAITDAASRNDQEYPTDYQTLSFSRDGQVLAAATSGAPAQPCVIDLFEAQTGRLICTTGQTSARAMCVVVEANAWVVSGDSDGQIAVWDARTGSHIRDLRSDGAEVVHLAIHPGGNQVMGINNRGKIAAWNPVDGDKVAVAPAMKSIPGRVQNALWAPDGQSLAVTTAEGVYLVHDGGNAARKLCDISEKVYDLRFEGQHIALITVNDKAVLQHVRVSRDGRLDGNPVGQVIRIRDPVGIVYDAELQPGGALVATGGSALAINRDCTVRLWSLSSGKPAGRLDMHQEPVRSLAFSPDGRLLASAAFDGSLCLWAMDGQPRDVPADIVQRVAFDGVQLEIRPPRRIARRTPNRDRDGERRQSSVSAAGVDSQPKPGGLKPDEFLTNSLGIRFAFIPAGEFLMGSPPNEEGYIDDETQHRVRVTKPFLMANHPVTRGQFAAFVNASGYKTEAENDGWSHVWTVVGWGTRNGETWREPEFEQADNHPVVCVSWNDAQAFTQWLSDREGGRYRLPTEAEWEYACRAGTTTPFSSGQAISTDQANYDGSLSKGVYRRKTTPVGSFPPNAWGLYDIHGNVWDWCSDWYGAYPDGAATDPTGPTVGKERVLRGGSWDANRQSCRAEFRFSEAPHIRSSSFGFRLVLDVASESDASEIVR